MCTTGPAGRAASRRRAVGWAVVAGLVLAGGGVPADAALTTPSCLAQKLKAWGRLRKCQRTEDAKAVASKPADPGKCQVRFQQSLASTSDKATAAAIPCRFQRNGDNTLTDFDTGLMWETKNGFNGPANPNDPHHPANLYTWSSSGSAANGTAFTDFLSRLNSCVLQMGGNPVFGGFAGHCDWRLPTVAEYRTIVPSGCPFLNPCIYLDFGPNVADAYWSSTNAGSATSPEAWFMSFSDGHESFAGKTFPAFVRAVRGAGF